MCIKAGNTELGSVRALMTMSLNAVVADVFDLEPEDLRPELRVYGDLHMNAEQAAEFSALVAEYFDDLRLDFATDVTLGEVFDRVVGRQFDGLPAEAF